MSHAKLTCSASVLLMRGRCGVPTPVAAAAAASYRGST